MSDRSFSPAPEAAVPAEETRSLLKSIRRIVRANDLRSRALAKSIGLTGPQLVILMAVAELGEVTTRALADHADLSPATVVTVLENLEHREIVQRYRSGSDRRIVYSRLMPKGQQLMSHAPQVFGEGFARRFANLPPDRRRELISSLSDLAELMSPNAPQRSPPAQAET